MRTRGLLDVLRDERKAKTSGGIYHKVQVELAYNSNHIEGSSLSLEETRWIFETATVQRGARVDDVVETANHFRCAALVIDRTRHPLSEGFIKKLHGVLKNGTASSRQSWFNVGDYKKLPNEVGGRETADPEAVGSLMRGLVSSYNESKLKATSKNRIFFQKLLQQPKDLRFRREQAAVLRLKAPFCRRLRHPPRV